MRAKIFEALSKEEKSNLITMMPNNACLADIMAQLESIELWSKMGSDKDSRRGKVLGVKPKDNEKPKKGRGSRRPMQTEEEPREVFTVA